MKIKNLIRIHLYNIYVNSESSPKGYYKIQKSLCNFLYSQLTIDYQNLSVTDRWDIDIELDGWLPANPEFMVDRSNSEQARISPRAVPL